MVYNAGVIYGTCIFLCTTRRRGVLFLIPDKKQILRQSGTLRTIPICLILTGL